MAAVLTCMGAAGCTEQVPEPTVSADVLVAESAARGVAAPAEMLVENCNVEHINGVSPTPRVRYKGSRLRVDGWVAGKLDGDGQLVGKATLQLTPTQGEQAGGNIRFPTQEVTGRSDVAQTLGLPGLVNAGFQVNVDISHLASGNYLVALKRGEFTCAHSFELEKL